MKIELPADLQDALAKGEGSIEGSNFVLFSVDAYRDMMGVADKDAWDESLAAIDRALADADAGRTYSLDEARRLLDEKYGIHR